MKSWPRVGLDDPPYWTGDGYEVPPPVDSRKNHDDLMQEWLENTPINASYLWTDWELVYNNWTYLPNLTDLSEEDYDLWHSSESSSEPSSFSSSESKIEDFNYQKEDSRMGWLFASKACVQLVFNPIIGTIINRYM